MIAAGSSPSRETASVRVVGGAGKLVESPRCTAGGREVAVDDRRLWIRIFENVRDFPIAIKDVDRNVDHAQAKTSEIKIDDLDTVGQIDAEPITTCEPTFGEGRCHARCSLVDVSEGEGLQFA